MTRQQNLAEGAAGVALLHLENGDWPAAFRALRLAVADGVSIAEGASLYYGAPAIAFALATVDHPGVLHARSIAVKGTIEVTHHRLDAAHRRIDQHRNPHFAEYDLIRGLTGLGAALRRLREHDVLRKVLEYLVRLTEPINGLPGWWCWNGPDRHKPAPLGGHANFGIAHGITGPLALMSLARLDGITVPDHTEAIWKICRWLDRWQQDTHAAIWWPQTITLHELHAARPDQREPLRPSWCYGTPGVARAQQLAALALQNTSRQRAAEAAFNRCINDITQIRRIKDRSLCHGSGGLLAVGRRIAAEALCLVSLDPLIRLHSQTAAPRDEPAGFLEGAAGATLASGATTATSWDACLLLC